MATTGQQCNKCFAGKWSVAGVYDTATLHTRYLVCSRCKAKSKEVVTAEGYKRRLKRMPYLHPAEIRDSS